MRWRAAGVALLLLLPFVLIVAGARSVVPSLAAGMARRLHGLAVLVEPGAPSPPAPPDALRAIALKDAGDDGPDAGFVAKPRAGIDGAAAAPLGPVRIRRSLVQRAIDESGRITRGRTAYGPDGGPIGVRVVGVDGAKIGVHDGDLIVAVDGKPTLDAASAADAALSVVARGEPVLHATLTRDGAPFEVTLELPRVPTDAGTMPR